MKDGIKEILGKEISGVIVAESAREPRTQMFLTFSDGTYFEIWGNLFTGAGGVDRGGEQAVVRYVESTGGKITGIYPRPQQS